MTPRRTVRPSLLRSALVSALSAGLALSMGAVAPPAAQADDGADARRLVEIAPDTTLGFAAAYHEGGAGSPQVSDAATPPSVAFGHEQGALITAFVNGQTIQSYTVDPATMSPTRAVSGALEGAFEEFGGIYIPGDGYIYVLTGRDNPAQDDAAKVFCVQRFTLDLKLVTTWTVPSRRVPTGWDDTSTGVRSVFTAGGGNSMVANGRVYLSTTRDTYLDGNGIARQGAVLLVVPDSPYDLVNVQTMTEEGGSHKELITDVGYNTMLMVDHRVERGRGIEFSWVDNVSGDWHVSQATAPEASGAQGDRYTGMTLGDAALADNGNIAVAVGRSAPQKDKLSGTTGNTTPNARGQVASNVYLAMMNPMTMRATTMWLTYNDPVESDVIVREPTLNVLPDGTCVVMWGEELADGTFQMQYRRIDVGGEALLGSRTFEATPYFPATRPQLVGGTLFWVGAPTPGGSTGNALYALDAVGSDEPTVRLRSSAKPPAFPAPTAPVYETTTTPKPTISGEAKAGSTLTAAIADLTVIYPVYDGTGAEGTILLWEEDITYRWFRNGAPIPGATGATYVPTAADAASRAAITVVATHTAEPVFEAASDAVVPVPADEWSLVTAPAIPTPAQVGYTLTASAGTYSALPDSVTYQWLRDGVVVKGRTESQYWLDAGAVGHRYSARVTAVRQGQPDIVTETEMTPAVTWPPEPIGMLEARDPIIKGTPQVGQALSVDVAQEAVVVLAVTPQPGVKGYVNVKADSTTFQWTRDGRDIPGATGPTYTVTDADSGRLISVAKTQAFLSYTPVTVAAEGRWVLGSLAWEGPARIAGEPAVGQTLTAQPGSITPQAEIAVQWQCDMTDIKGATGPTHTVTAADRGCTITYRFTATRQGYEPLKQTSDEVRVPGVFSAKPAPVISGTPRVGWALWVEAPKWEPSVSTASYRWRRDGRDIPGADRTSYTLTPDDLGHVITVAFTGRASDIEEATVVSAPTQRIAEGFLNYTPDPSLPLFVAIGVPQRVVVDPPPEGVSLTYQWAAADVPIPGATSESFTPREEDYDKFLTCVVTATKPGYTTTSRTASSGTPVRWPFLLTPAPRITGTARVGETLQVTPGRWTAPAGDSEVTSWFSWHRGEHVLVADGEGAREYVPTAFDIGSQVFVEQSGQSKHSTVQEVRSAPVTVGLPFGQRIKGTSRVETAVEVSLRGHARGKGGTVIVATGWNYPDSLAATPFAAKLDAPLLLTQRDLLPGATVKEIQRIKPDQIIVLGGSVAVSDGVVGALGRIDGVNAKVRRIAGKSRYDTAEMIVREGWGESGAERAFVATGEHFTDALAAGAAAAAQDFPVVLVDGRRNAASASSVKLLEDLGVVDVRIAGGEVAISRGVEETIRPGAQTKRYKGKSRYETAAQIADDFHTRYGQAYIATGEHFADALAGGVLAGVNKAPLLLSEKVCEPQATNDHLMERVKPAEVFVLGGSVAIADPVLEHAVCR